MTSDPILEPPHSGEGWKGEIFATLALAWPLAAANVAAMLVHVIDVSGGADREAISCVRCHGTVGHGPR